MSEWGLLPFDEVFFDETRKGIKIKKEDYLRYGLFPIVDQGKEYIAGFTNKSLGLYADVPAIIFGDHTRIIKYIDEPLFLGADGVKLLKSKISNVDDKYLYYFLLTVHIPDTGYNRHFKWLKELQIPLPPLGTQQKIANILDKASGLIEKRKAQIAKLDLLVKAKFVDMFGDPVSNPMGWEVVKLEKFYVNGKNAVKCGPFGSALKKNEYVKTGIPVWTMDNITKNNSFIDNPCLWITISKYIELKNYNTIYGDIIISRAGTVGKMCVVNTKYETAIISTNLIRLRLNDELLPLYFVMLFNIFGSKVCRLKTGNDDAFTYMNTAVLNSISFPYPPLPLQTEFANFVESVETQKALLQTGLEKLELNYKSLMQNCFNGTLFK